MVQARNFALKTWEPFAKRKDLSLKARVLSWVRWHATRVSSRTRKRLKPVSVMALMRHLRQALLRRPRPVRLGAWWWSDVRTALLKKSKTDVGRGSATPLTPVQFQQLLQAADESPRATHLKRACILLAAVGATRIAEATRRSARLIDRGTVFDLIVFPKGGRELKVASLPGSDDVRALLNMEGRTILRRPLPTDAYRIVYDHIKVTARACAWPTGKWTTYSLRHGALSMAFDLSMDDKEARVRDQTGHVRNIPITYRLGRNPRRERQLSVVAPVIERMLGSAGKQATSGKLPSRKPCVVTSPVPRVTKPVPLSASSAMTRSETSRCADSSPTPRCPTVSDADPALVAMAVKASLPRPCSQDMRSFLSRSSCRSNPSLWDKAGDRSP